MTGGADRAYPGEAWEPSLQALDLGPSANLLLSEFIRAL